MKKLFVLFAIAALSFSTNLYADGPQTKKQVKTTGHSCRAQCPSAKKSCCSPKTVQPATQNATLKAHVCNDKCTKEKCNILHGEKGHKCNDACKTAVKKENVKKETK